jgi:hypothetical protein
MDTAAQLALKTALEQHEITWQAALAQLTANPPKPWHTAEWAVLRERLLGDRCQECGSTDPPFVLQHLWHPKPFKVIESLIHQKYYAAYQQSHPLQYPEEEPGDRPACPRCSSTVIKSPKNIAPRWKCYGRQRGRECGHIFEKPTTVKAFTPEQKQQQQLVKNTLYRAWIDAFHARYRDEIGTRAVLQSIDEHVRYMRGDDVATFCKPCAYLWDVKKVRRCRDCGEAYHAVFMPCCDVCWPQRTQASQPAEGSA